MTRTFTEQEIIEAVLGYEEGCRDGKLRFLEDTLDIAIEKEAVVVATVLVSFSRYNSDGEYVDDSDVQAAIVSAIDDRLPDELALDHVDARSIGNNPVDMNAIRLMALECRGPSDTPLPPANVGTVLRYFTPVDQPTRDQVHSEERRLVAQERARKAEAQLRETELQLNRLAAEKDAREAAEREKAVSEDQARADADPLMQAVSDSGPRPHEH